MDSKDSDMHRRQASKHAEKTTKPDRRAYKRVAMENSSFSCHVKEGGDPCQLIDLSLSGCCLEYADKLPKGDTATVTLSSSENIFSSPLKLSARVVRTGKNNAALEFLKTNEDNYMMLQAILLYHSREPHLMAIEFPEQPHLAKA